MLLAFKVELYGYDDKCPVEEFILEQNNKMQAKIFHNIELLEQEGNMLREPYSKHLEDGIFELRNKVGSDITRVLYFFVIGETIVSTMALQRKLKKLQNRKFKKQKITEMNI